MVVVVVVHLVVVYRIYLQKLKVPEEVSAIPTCSEKERGERLRSRLDRRNIFAME